MKANELAIMLRDDALRLEHPGALAKCARCRVNLYEHNYIGISHGKRPCGRFKDDNKERRLKMLKTWHQTYLYYRNLISQLEGI